MPTDKRTRQKAGRQERLERERKAAKRRTQIRRGVIIAVIAVVVVGSVWLLNRNSSKTTSTTTTTGTSASNGATAVLQAKADKAAVAAGCPASTKTKVNTMTWSSPPAMTIDTSKTYVATVKTTTGTFTVTLDAKSAPKTVNNFVFLAQQGYYHCVIFHRVIPNFMDQTGDPTGTGTGSPGYTIPDENPPTATPQYPLGAVAMANTGAANSGGAQFFIVTGSEGEQLPPTYTLFGQVPSDQMAVPNLINQQGGTAASNGVPPKVTQRILSITISSS